MLCVHFGPWFGFLAAHHESIWILGGEASWKLKGASWPRKCKRNNGGCGSHADEGEFMCWRGMNPGGSNSEMGMSIKGERIGEQRTFSHFWERGYFVGEKNRGWGASSELRAWRKASTLWFFEEESYSISVSRSHHQRTWIIFGGDYEVSMLNFFFTYRSSSSSSYAFSSFSSSFISFDVKIVLLGCG